MITIKSKKDGFRRCGIAHPAAETTYPDDRFTIAELADLQAEPMLIVATAEDKPASPPPVMEEDNPASPPPLTGGDKGEGDQAEAGGHDRISAGNGDRVPRSRGKK